MGDRILKVNGTDVTAATHQEAVMELLRPGDEIKLTIQHDPLPVGFQVSTEINKTPRSNWWLCYFNSFVHIKPHDVLFTFEFVFAVIFSPSSTSFNCEMFAFVFISPLVNVNLAKSMRNKSNPKNLKCINK